MRVAPGGLPIAGVFLAIGAGIVALGRSPWGGVGIAAGLAVLWFYRDPARSNEAPGLLAPADGRVRAVEADGDRVRLAIFLNLWDVHVVRAPWAGRVADRTRVAGHRSPAFLERAAENAGVAFDIVGGSVVLRAGVLARRVRPYVGTGEAVDRGERIGHIALGSRVDVVLPPAVGLGDVVVSVGDRVRAGETVIADGDDHAAGGGEGI